MIVLATGGLVARPQVAAADTACLLDTAGVDDINATQKDLNEFCQSPGDANGFPACTSSDADLTWTWDDTGWSGMNTGDACALYDTDGDGKANFALCATVADDPAVQSAQSPRFYSCDDSKTLNCGGGSGFGQITTALSSCSVGIVDDGFLGSHANGNVCNGTDCTTEDTQAHCCVKRADFPSGTTPELVDVCSYPSSSPSSSPSECVKAVLCTSDTDCSELDDACNVGTCASDGLTKRCVATPKTNGTACNDGDACTQTDTCQAGVCTGTNPVSCSASDECHAAGTCDSSTGMCSNPTKSDGAACTDDGDLCTNDVCTTGVCTHPDKQITCSASDECHTAGTCDPATGMCTNPAKSDGSACTDDGNLCTNDVCTAGACTHPDKQTGCSASDECHTAGTCDPSTGTCTNPTKSDGSACTDDGNLCTNDVCTSGACTHPTKQITCTASDDCHTAGGCDPATGTCTNPVKSDGSACTDDGNLCTNDVCTSGACTHPAKQITCTALDQCHVAGSCIPSTGLCSNPNAADGTSCTDNDACTLSDTCQDGTCVGGNGPSSEPGCETDTGGADDAVGQKDLTNFCVNVSGSCAGTIFTWQWDDTAWSGSNTGDACALYDTDGDGLANYALCVTVGGKPAVQTGQSPRFYTCNDTKQFNCAGATLRTMIATSCVVNGLVPDPFANLASRKANKCGGSSCLTKDTQAQCCVMTSDLPATAALIDVCSYPSQSPSSDPSECVKTVFCTSNADCTVSNSEGTCMGTCTNVAGVNQCTF